MRAGLINGRYRPLERRAIGGMASLWRARDERTGETVALKRLHPYLVGDPGARRRLAREAAALAALDHPAIVRPRGVIDDPEDPALVMEFAEGRSLRERLTADGPLDPDEAVAIAATVADALGVAHDAGIVHRDVKPANILVEETGAVHLVDFGIASVSEPDGTLTAPRTMIGTIRYIAPERLAGAPATPAGDVWALGAVLYEMVTGQPAISGTELTDVLAARHDPLDAATLPGSLGGVVRRAMAMNPADRYPDATAFRDALLETEVAERLDAEVVDGTPDQEAPTQVVPLNQPSTDPSSPVLARAPAARLSPVDRVAAAFFGGVLLVALVVAIGSMGLSVEGGGGEVTTVAASDAVVEAAGPTPQETVARSPIVGQRGDGPGNGRGKGHGKGKGD